MKTQHTLIVIIAIILSSLNSIASHNAGGEISYTHLTGNEYLIRCTIYRDCFGIPAPTAITVTVESATCSFNQNITIPALPGTVQ